MSNILDTIRALPLTRQLMLGGAVASVLVVMASLALGAAQSPKVVLYSGLDAESAGAIVDELERSGVDYDLVGDTIQVRRNERDNVRFALAREGLPRQSIKGYELLDDVNGFSVTSEMYNAAYWRAKEGELTRTILSIPGVDAARVHIGASLRSGFLRSQSKPSASVTLSSAYALNASQIEGVQYLVALAIPGMAPGDVAVVDANAGVLAGPGLDAISNPGMQAASQAELLEQKILALLEARVGPGNARVTVSLDVERNRERTSAVTFDPQSRVVRSRTTTESNQVSQNGGAAITVASNLPEGAVAGPGQNGTVETSTENVVYEVNEIRTERETLPGDIRRLSVAVLINSAAVAGELAAGGAEAGPVDEAAMVQTLTQLVSSAAGIDVDRGDSIVVDLMPFVVQDAEGLIARPSLVERLVQQYFWVALHTLMLGFVGIALLLGVIRPMLRQGQSAQLALPVPAGGEGGEAGAGLGAEAGAGAAIEMSAQPPNPFDTLRSAATDQQDAAADLLQEWLEQGDPAGDRSTLGSGPGRGPGSASGAGSAQAPRDVSVANG